MGSMSKSQPKAAQDEKSGLSPFVKTSTAAAHFGVCRKTIVNWIHAGHIAARKIGKNYRIPREAIEK
jgi:excisionase family DNA binding protein